MKKIILSIIALIAILWIAMFVTDTKVLVKEITPMGGWSCTYFNGRSLITKNYKAHVDACPNLL